MRHAIFDLGSNSIKMLVTEVRGDWWTTVLDRMVVTRLGEGLLRGAGITPEAAERSIQALECLMRDAKACGVNSYHAAGTACMREAPNADRFRRLIRTRTGLRVEILSEEEEARLALVAAQFDSEFPSGATVFDVGGGSTELIAGTKQQTVRWASCPVGAVRLMQMFHMDHSLGEGTLAEVFQRIERELTECLGGWLADGVIGIGGTVSTLAAVCHAVEPYSAERIHGKRIDRRDIMKQIQWYRRRNAFDRIPLPGLQAERSDVILAGAVIVYQLLTFLGAENCSVSSTGLRHGLFFDRVLNPRPRHNPPASCQSSSTDHITNPAD